MYSVRPRWCIIEVAQFSEGVRIKAWGQQSDLGAIANGGGGRHGKDAVHMEARNVVEGRGEIEDNEIITTTKTGENDNRGGGDTG